MKKILITGANSYIGSNVEKWLKSYPGKYSVDMISLRRDSWKEIDFSIYNVVLHLAAVVHKKEKPENESLYMRVNRDLAVEVANRAKKAGVKQFIFMSTMSVYGIDKGVINRDSPLIPKNYYGKSKLLAEKMIASLEDDTYNIVILRPPMIYGKGCKGNYPRLARLALKLPLFPDVKNQRSMIFIDNLCEFIKLLIDDCGNGLFFPQNSEYVCSSNMVKLIAKVHGKEMRLTKVFNPLLKKLRSGVLDKVFGDLVYEQWMSEYKDNYCIMAFEDSITKTEV